jgi:hypothetical protein
VPRSKLLGSKQAHGIQVVLELIGPLDVLRRGEIDNVPRHLVEAVRAIEEVVVNTLPVEEVLFGAPGYEPLILGVDPS